MRSIIAPGFRRAEGSIPKAPAAQKPARPIGKFPWLGSGRSFAAALRDMVDGSAVHPPLRGRPSNAGAPAPSAQPARVIYRSSGQRDRQGKNRHSERRRIAIHCSRIAQGGRRSACRQSRSNRCQADSVCVRGPSHQNAAPCEHVADARKQSASSVPLIYGALRGTAPFEGVAQDAQRLALRGRLSPPESATLRQAKIAVD
jgi:hypothetical protein